ncbi:MAG: ATP-binding protein [Bacilli bacterium]|jgi:hypothetical protein|nr:ATP-binding protein [Bacilli bacterium]HHU24301.1 ATP-binding protein [Acholeplasmataceae bacterium]
MKAPLIIIIGHYGSGKSEFSVNLAIKKARDHNVCLADLDIVNPYFRSREARAFLSNHNIEVISDTYNSTKGLDMPYLSPAIQGRIAKRDKFLILDCGGDPNGIKVLKQFRDLIYDTPYEMWMIVNIFRPETSKTVDIISMYHALQASSGLRITGFINNSNLLRHTSVKDMLYANQIMQEVVEQTRIKVVYTSGIPELLKQLPGDILGEKFPIQIILREKWL